MLHNEIAGPAVHARRIFAGVYMEKPPHRLSAWPAPQGWPFYWPHAAARGSMSPRKAGKKNLRQCTLTKSYMLIQIFLIVLDNLLN